MECRFAYRQHYSTFVPVAQGEHANFCMSSIQERIPGKAQAEAEKRGFTYKRSLSSWLMEWKAHNYLSDKNIETSRTSSVDINEDEKLIRRFGYFVLALFYKAILIRAKPCRR